MSVRDEENIRVARARAHDIADGGIEKQLDRSKFTFEVHAKEHELTVDEKSQVLAGDTTLLSSVRGVNVGGKVAYRYFDVTSVAPPLTLFLFLLLLWIFRRKGKTFFTHLRDEIVFFFSFIFRGKKRERVESEEKLQGGFWKRLILAVIGIFLLISFILITKYNAWSWVPNSLGYFLGILTLTAMLLALPFHLFPVIWSKVKEFFSKWREEIFWGALIFISLVFFYLEKNDYEFGFDTFLFCFLSIILYVFALISQNIGYNKEKARKGLAVPLGIVLLLLWHVFQEHLQINLDIPWYIKLIVWISVSIFILFVALSERAIKWFRENWNKQWFRVVLLLLLVVKALILCICYLLFVKQVVCG